MVKSLTLALAEDLNLVPSTPVGQLPASYNSSSRGISHPLLASTHTFGYWALVELGAKVIGTFAEAIILRWQKLISA